MTSQLANKKFESPTTAIHATSVVSTNISRRLGVSADLERFSMGIVQNYVPKTYSEYRQYRHYMHDILCLGLVSGGYYESEELTLGKLNIHSNDTHLLSQKPDLYSIEADVLRVGEVSLTYNYEKRQHDKDTKYHDLFALIEAKSHLHVQYSTILVDLTDAEWKDNIVKIPQSHLNLLERFVDNITLIHSTNEGESFREQMNLDIHVNFPFSYSTDSIKYSLESELGISLNSSMLETLASGIYSTDLSDHDDYIDKLTDVILTMKRHERPFPHPEPKAIDGFLNEWDDLKSIVANTQKIPVLLQLGAPNLTDQISVPSRTDSITMFRESGMYGGYADHVMASNTADEEYLETGLLRLNLTEDELKMECMQGPGRKKYIKANNIEIKRSAPTHIGIDTKHITLVNELIDLVQTMEPSDFLKREFVADYNTSGTNLSETLNACVRQLSKSGFDFILSFYESITREIILNSMKRRKTRQYILAHSGFENIWFLIAPGPQLRTESNIEFVKIISNVEPIVHPLVRSWHTIGNHWESDWLSVDTDRLKHWARCRHRVNLSIIGSAEKMITPEKEISTCLKEEINYGNYGLMSLIYLEDKANTSTTIQTTRYVFMKSMGDKQLSGLMSKFPSRVSSVLQSLVLQRTIEFAQLTCNQNTNMFIRSQNVKRDENIGTLDETTTGVVGSVPRIFTVGDYVPIRYSFNEIYWCMMYNKDRQNKVQDSMKILNKIAKEEQKLREELNRRGDDESKLLHLFGVHSTKEDIEHMTGKPESHYFSHRAVHIGCLLQDMHKENFAPKSGWLSKSKIHNILNKNLSDYATFKASVSGIQSEIDMDDLDELKKVGQRTKCIELVHEMVSNERLNTAMEVAMSFSGSNSLNFKTVIQIFKKNQVGGVREILILFIKARVLINLTEELARLLSKADKRETLTKGKDKRLMMRGDYEELSSSFQEGTPLMFIKNSYDMSTWCQKFIPTIFLPIFNIREEKLEDMRHLCRFVLLSHCVKEIEFPQALVGQWMRHKNEKHEESHMQHYKEKFLKDHRPKMMNISNMGQGILHYNSTVLALSCQSLRDYLFEKCLQKLLRPVAIKWKTRVGSDDKGDTIALDLSYDDCLYQAQLFEQCASVSERLHAMELSIKSASGNTIYEFNSAYMANLEVQSPVIKFTLAAVDMIGTDSCTQFVNESFSRIRQLRENGGSSLLCQLAHHYNKSHFESIFRVGNFMTNDPTKIFNLPRENIPYDFGNYPIYDADIQDMIGPEYHNYTVFTNSSTPDYILRMLYTNAIKIEDGNVLPDNDEGLFKKDTFNISQGLVKQLENMKSRLNLSREDIEHFLESNPFMIIRGPKSVEETSIAIASKLYTRGAATSLRRTSPVIYLGRLPAFENATAWSLYQKEEDGEITKYNLTFRDYMDALIKIAKEDTTNVREFMPLIFPQHNSFEVVRSYVGSYGLRRSTHKIFSQSIRTWVLNNFNYNFYHSLKDILETSFGLSSNASNEDVQEMRKSIPFDITSYEGFIENCRVRNIKPLDLFYYLTKVYKSKMSKKAQVFATGPSTSSLNLTLSNIKKYNHMIGSIMEIDFEVDQDNLSKALNISTEFDRLKLGFNILMLEVQGSLKSTVHYENILDEFILNGSSLRSLCETTIRGLRSINHLDGQMRKITLMLASKILDKDEFLSKLISWKQLCYTYIKRQKKTETGDWVGDLSVLVNYSDECFIVHQVSGFNFIELSRIVEMGEFQLALNKISKILGFELDSYFTHTSLRPMDIYKSGKKLYQSRAYVKNKLRLNMSCTSSFRYNRIRDLTNFKLEHKNLKDGSTQILLTEDSGSSITVSHYPGHYYPVELPKDLSINNDLYVNGLRATKLFKRRNWFFDGRLHPFNSKESIDILKNHLRPDLMSEVAIDSRSKVNDYINEFDDYYQPALDDDPEMNMTNINPVQLNEDLVKQMIDIDSGMTTMELFQNATNRLLTSEWADAYKGESDLNDLKEQDEEQMINFVKALGENKVRKNKKDFFILTNMKLNISFMNRILDLFFKNNSILSENTSDLPDYVMSVQRAIDDKEGDVELLMKLKKYIIGRIVNLTGESETTIVSKLNRIMEKKRHFNTLDRLVKYLNVDSPDLYSMLGGQFAEEQEDESDEDSW